MTNDTIPYDRPAHIHGSTHKNCRGPSPVHTTTTADVLWQQIIDVPASGNDTKSTKGRWFRSVAVLHGNHWEGHNAFGDLMLKALLGGI